MNNEIPRHVAIILDGNGRWAEKRGLSRSMGHSYGFKNLKSIAVYALSKGIEILSVYAFSCDNFKRSKEEVDYLMDLFVKKFKEEKEYFNKKNVKVVFSGVRENLRQDVYDSMEEIKTYTKNNTGGIFNICLNYSSQLEIVNACKDIAVKYKNNEINLDDINEKSFNSYLHQDLLPVDFVIRTSGEQRLSNFMLYQISYAEFYFPDVYFPDFNKKEFDKALDVFKSRNRRFGSIKKQN
ncbi:MAG: polyprenyl diphosphate synthase [Bacilli bacterium]